MGLTKLGWQEHRFPMPESFPFVVEVELAKGSAGIRARGCGSDQMEMHFAPSDSKETVKRTIVLHESSDHKISGFDTLIKKRVRIKGKDVWIFIGDLDTQHNMTN